MQPPAPVLWAFWMASLSCTAQTLVIRLYDYSDLSAKEVLRVAASAEQAFARSGVEVAWRHCRGVLAGPANTCEDGLKVNEIVVRLQPGGFLNSSRERTPLGHTYVTTEGGKYASVFVPAVRTEAESFAIAFDLLMGYAVAHEAAHCLGLRHSSTGLMRGGWNRRDADAMSRLGLHLTKQEARHAVAHLAMAHTIP